MSLNSHVSNMICNIKNSVIHKNIKTTCFNTKYNYNILLKLHKLHYIKDINIDNNILLFNISTVSNNIVITDIKIVSKPSCRIYVQPQDISKYKNKLYKYAILSTNIGIISCKESIKMNIGGELILLIK